jgi:hypothetical protein
MSTKHTPGPWAVGFSDGSGSPYYILAGEHAAIKALPAVVVRGGHDDWGVEHGVQRIEDAALIAAAPELYKELAHLVALIEPCINDGRASIPGLATLNAAHAALAKARGEA